MSNLNDKVGFALTVVTAHYNPDKLDAGRFERALHFLQITQQSVLGF